MIPKRILLENFLSFSSPATEIVFTDDEPLWVLAGPNGVGKSAVFDAMTYALFGKHRGSGTREAKVEELIRHGTNGFRIVFEFEFNGIDYRITRTRSGRTTQRVEQYDRAGDSWRPVAHVNSAEEVRSWAEQTLGLPFDAFKASVLLRQGEADAIITAAPAARLATLKKIIGAERFEALSNRVHTVARTLNERLKTLCNDKDALIRERGVAPTPTELEDASAALAKAEEARTAAHEAVARAGERLTAAKAWAALEAKDQGLRLLVRDADARADAAERIRAEKTRLDDLTVVVPVFKQLLSLTNGLVATKRTFAEKQAEATRLTDALQAKQLREQIAQAVKCLDAVDGVKKLRDELRGFDPYLAELLGAAQERLATATEAETAVLATKAGDGEQLKRAKARQQKFAGVGVGIPCSFCGQEVTAEHAQRERDRLATELRDLEESVQRSQNEAVAAGRAKKNAAEEWRRLDNHLHNQEATAKRLADMEEMLRTLGMTAEPDDLFRQITAQTAEAESCETTAGRHAQADRSTLEMRLTEVKNKTRADEQAIAIAQERQSILRGQLLPSWMERCERMDAPAVDALDAEQHRLAASDVAKQFRRLDEDAIRRGEWEKQLAEIAEETAKIAAVDHIPAADAQDGVRLAQEAAKEAEASRDDAKATANRLVSLAADHAKLEADIRDAERKADLHRKLDDLLGKSGLQRELVRTAEREIVRLANDTVQNLSDGDLTVELDDGADGDDEVFALRVRQADAATPTGVNYLSGSQKFRLAISVALAIGRFAAGQARPLECVIIDEGFGSLDHDGLRAAADELNRLRRELRRIIVVSHQEEFADRFPVVVKLSKGESGAVAEAVRRQV